MSRHLVAALAAVSAACASQKAAQQPVVKNDVQYSTPGQPKPKGVMRCHLERDTGSNYAERVCSYDEPKNDEGDAAVDETMRRLGQRSAQQVKPD